MRGKRNHTYNPWPGTIHWTHPVCLDDKQFMSFLIVLILLGNQRAADSDWSSRDISLLFKRLVTLSRWHTGTGWSTGHGNLPETHTQKRFISKLSLNQFSFLCEVRLWSPLLPSVTKHPFTENAKPDVFINKILSAESNNLITNCLPARSRSGNRKVQREINSYSVVWCLMSSIDGPFQFLSTQ